MIREIWRALKRWWVAPESKGLLQTENEALPLLGVSRATYPGPLLDPTKWKPLPKGFPPIGRNAYPPGEPEIPVGHTVLADEFAVAGPPRRIPWSRRKKELEQEARQKRRQREEFRHEQS